MPRRRPRPGRSSGAFHRHADTAAQCLVIYRTARWCVVGAAPASASGVPAWRRARAGATRRSEVPERRRPGPERRPLPALRRGAGRIAGLQAQHVPHHLDVVIPAGLHVPVEVHDSCALCIADNNVPTGGIVIYCY